jgi:hypothetical protein
MTHHSYADTHAMVHAIASADPFGVGASRTAAHYYQCVKRLKHAKYYKTPKGRPLRRQALLNARAWLSAARALAPISE